MGQALTFLLQAETPEWTCSRAQIVLLARRGKDHTERVDDHGLELSWGLRTIL